MVINLSSGIDCLHIKNRVVVLIRANNADGVITDRLKHYSRVTNKSISEWEK
jgi:hypothetical protein